MADGRPCKQNFCSTRLAVYCKPQDRAAIIEAISGEPDECFSDKLCYGVRERHDFDGRYATLEKLLLETERAVLQDLDTMISLAERYDISYRLEAYCDFLWEPKAPKEWWDTEVETLLSLLKAELAIEIKWRDERMWRCGFPQRGQEPQTENEAPFFEEIESMEELL